MVRRNKHHPHTKGFLSKKHASIRWPWARRESEVYSKSTASTPDASRDRWTGYFEPRSTCESPTSCGLTRDGSRGPASREDRDD